MSPNLTNYPDHQIWALAALPFSTHLFLLHQLRIWTVIHDLFPEDRRGQWTVYLLRIDIFELSIEYKFISLHPQTDCRLLPEQNKGENVTVLEIGSAWVRCLENAAFKYLLPTAEEKLVGVDSVGDGTTNERHPMKHKWGFIGVFHK